MQSPTSDVKYRLTGSTSVTQSECHITDSLFRRMSAHSLSFIRQMQADEKLDPAAALKFANSRTKPVAYTFDTASLQVPRLLSWLQVSELTCDTACLQAPLSAVIAMTTEMPWQWQIICKATIHEMIIQELSYEGVIFESCLCRLQTFLPTGSGNFCVYHAFILQPSSVQSIINCHRNGMSPRNTIQGPVVCTWQVLVDDQTFGRGEIGTMRDQV